MKVLVNAMHSGRTGYYWKITQYNYDHIKMRAYVCNSLENTFKVPEAINVTYKFFCKLTILHPP